MNRREFLNTSLSAALAVGQGELNPPDNQRIRQAREAALAVLKPSQSQVERAFELHANATVIEAYGFAPSCAPDGDALRAAMEAGASDSELWDLNEDMRMTRCVTNAVERTEFMQAWKASGITCIFQNSGEESQDPLKLMKRLAHRSYVSDFLGGFVRRGVDAEDIVAAKQAGRRCFIFVMNGVPLAQRWISPEDELQFLPIFFRLGVRMMHLTYQRRNMIGDGCAEPANGGLSDFGRMVVAEMNRVGIIVDVAHSGWRTSLEAAKASKSPMVASHSTCAAVNQHIRSKPDEVIRAIVDTGGFIGICAIPQFLGRTRDLNAMLDHIDYVAKRFGVDHVAIATDVSYTSRNTEAEQKKIPRRGRARRRWEYFWPPNALGGSNASLAWTNWPMFTVGLVQRGYSDDDIRKILGGNVLRVARAVMPKKITGDLHA